MGETVLTKPKMGRNSLLGRDELKKNSEISSRIETKGIKPVPS